MEPCQNVLLVGAQGQSTDTRCTARWVRLEEGNLSDIAYESLPEGYLQDLNLAGDWTVPHDQVRPIATKPHIFGLGRAHTKAVQTVVGTTLTASVVESDDVALIAHATVNEGLIRIFEDNCH